MDLLFSFADKFETKAQFCTFFGHGCIIKRIEDEKLIERIFNPTFVNSFETKTQFSTLFSNGSVIALFDEKSRAHEWLDFKESVPTISFCRMFKYAAASYFASNPQDFILKYNRLVDIPLLPSEIANLLGGAHGGRVLKEEAVFNAIIAMKERASAIILPVFNSIVAAQVDDFIKYLGSEIAASASTSTALFESFNASGVEVKKIACICGDVFDNNSQLSNHVTKNKKNGDDNHRTQRKMKL